MNRQRVELLHTAANRAFWYGNPEFSASTQFKRSVITACRPLWHIAYKGIINGFFDPEKVIAINSESVVALDGPDAVNKHMFSYPHDMTLDQFETTVRDDIAVVAKYLDGIALPTKVSIERAFVFRNPAESLEAVTQRQRRLDLNVHIPLNLAAVQEEGHTPATDQTVRDIEAILHGTERMITNEGKYPDIFLSGGNLRRNILDGSLDLIDVMPINTDGTRAIGGNRLCVMSLLTDQIKRFEDIAGAYGA